MKTCMKIEISDADRRKRNSSIVFLITLWTVFYVLYSTPLDWATTKDGLSPEKTNRMWICSSQKEIGIGYSSGTGVLIEGYPVNGGGVFTQKLFPTSTL